MSRPHQHLSNPITFRPILSREVITLNWFYLEHFLASIRHRFALKNRKDILKFELYVNCIGIGFYWRMTLRVLLPSCEYQTGFAWSRLVGDHERGIVEGVAILGRSVGTLDKKKAMIKVLHAIPPLYIFGILLHFYSLVSAYERL